MAYKCTGEMCMVHIGDGNMIDMGNYYVNEETGEKVLITRRELAEKYSNLVSVRVYVRRPTMLAHRPACTCAKKIAFIDHGDWLECIKCGGAGG